MNDFKTDLFAPEVQLHRIRVTMKRYSTSAKYPELVPHDQMQFSVIPKDNRFLRDLNLLQGIEIESILGGYVCKNKRVYLDCTFNYEQKYNDLFYVKQINEQ